MTNVQVLYEQASRQASELAATFAEIRKLEPMPKDDDGYSMSWDDTVSPVVRATCRAVLRAAEVDNLGGCPLCQS